MTTDHAAWSQALQLMDELTTHAPAQLERELAALAQADPAVAALVQKLLGAQSRLKASEFLQALPALRIADVEVADDDSSYAGELLGAFELVSPLGRGGMGTVWRARYADGRMSREVAIKRPFKRTLGRNAGAQQSRLVAERLMRERQLLTPLAHPNIARLLDAGLDDSGQPFIALELVEGQALDHWANSQKASVSERLTLFCQVLDAVDHAHRSMVLHRDIKPGNICVDRDGSPKLLDFGVAKLLPPDGALADLHQEAPLTELTRQEQPALTLAYASPEQLRRGPLSSACDVYACGVVLFELLTGESPHRPPRGSRGALEETILSVTPELASRRDISEATALQRASSPKALRALLRGDLDIICQKALRIDPTQRYASAAAMADDLRRHLKRQPIAARAESHWYVLGRLVRRNRFAVAAVSVACSGLVATTAVALVKAQEAAQQAQLAATSAKSASAAQQFFASLLAGADPERNKTISDFDRRMLGRAFATAQTEYGNDPQALELILRQIGEIYRRQGLPAENLAVQERRHFLMQSAPQADVSHETRMGVWADWGRALLDSGQAQSQPQALAALHEASVLAQRITPTSAKSFVKAAVLVLGQHADALLSAGDLDRARAQANVALVSAERHLPALDPLRAFAHEAVAVSAKKQGRFDEARLHFEASAGVDASGLGRGQVDQINMLTGWAQMEYDAGYYQQAHAISANAIAKARQNLGDTGDLLTSPRLFALFSLVRLGQFDAAQHTMRTEFAADLAAIDDFQRGRAQFSQAWAAVAQRSFQRAKAPLAASRTALQNTPNWHARWLVLSANLALRQNTSTANTLRAKKWATQALALQNKWGLTQSRDYAQAGQALAVASHRLGEPNALATLQSGCEWVEKTFDANHPDRLRCTAQAAVLGAGGANAAALAMQSARDGLGSRQLQHSLLAQEIDTALAWMQQSNPPIATTPLIF